MLCDFWATELVEKKPANHLVVEKGDLPLPSALFKATNDWVEPQLGTTFFDLMQQPKSIFARRWSFHSSEWGEIHSPPGGWHRLLREKMKNDSRESTNQTLTMESLILAQDER